MGGWTPARTPALRERSARDSARDEGARRKAAGGRSKPRRHRQDCGCARKSPMDDPRNMAHACRPGLGADSFVCAHLDLSPMTVTASAVGLCMGLRNVAQQEERHIRPCNVLERLPKETGRGCPQERRGSTTARLAHSVDQSPMIRPPWRSGVEIACTPLGSLSFAGFAGPAGLAGFVVGLVAFGGVGKMYQGTARARCTRTRYVRDPS